MRKLKISVSIKIGILLSVGIIIILLGGYFSYKSLSSVVKLMKIENPPQYGFIAIRDINSSIEQAENNIRLYGITKEKQYLKQYQENVQDIDTNFKQLEEQYPEDQWFSAKIDTISWLLERKLVLWNDMIWLWQADSTAQNFSYLTRKLTKKEEEPEQERKFFQRLFGTNKTETQDDLDNEEILNKLSKIEHQEKVIEQRLLEKETELTLSSNLINEAFISLMEQLESYERKKELEHYENAQKLASIAYNRLTLFALSGILLSIFVLIAIIKYIKKNKQYNDILISSKIETEQLAKAKELFMAKVSHEIRTPLNAISGFIKQILKMPLEQKMQEKIEIVDSASDQLIRLINDVLDFTKLQSDKLTLHKTHFNPKTVIQNVCSLFYEMAKSKENVISYSVKNEKNLTLYGDVLRFQQILYNLTSNAVKFTEQGSIEIKAHIDYETKETILMHLEVKDNGLGIDSSKLNAVFKEYTQEDQDIATRYGGTGLGLTIVKKIAELFHGDIQLESKKGQGTNVICKLRFEPGREDQLVETPEKNIDNNLSVNLKILLADDEEYNRQLIASTLDKWNIHYDIAKNGLEAIELLQNNDYDFVLMDIRMPIINGIVATKFIRETLGSKTNVIGITADTSENLSAEIKKLFNTILTKPFTENELYELLQNEPKQKNYVLNKNISGNVKIQNKPADLANLLRVAENDMDFVWEMIEKFKQTTEQGLKDIQLAIKKEKYKQVADLAHKLVPACRHLGIKKLVDQLKQMEENALNQNKNVTLKLSHESEESLKQAAKSLHDQYNQAKK